MTTATTTATTTTTTNGGGGKAGDEERLKPVVFCGPSGVGKGTLIEMLMKRFGEGQFGFSVSHTTRKPREGETDGVHYHFTTVDHMKKEIADGKFIEHAEVHGRFYGTSFAAVDSVREAGKICVLDIDVQGVQNVKKSSLEPRYLFIAPPSMEALEKRLRGRNTEKEEDVLKRLANARAELDYGRARGNFDKVYINDDLTATFTELATDFSSWYPHLKVTSPNDPALSNAMAPKNNPSLKPIVICGPSGVGKGTLIEMLKKRFPNDQFGFSVSHTTRDPREGETDGVHYNFTNMDDMKKEIADGKFVEHAEVHGRMYGTSFAAVDSVRQAGKICILDIDVQGVKNVKKSPLKPRYVFIAPPNVDALEARLRGRKTETEEAIQTRLGNAKAELDYGQTAGHFDLVLTNDDLQETFEELVDVIRLWYPHLQEDARDAKRGGAPQSKICDSSCTVS